MTKDEFLAAWEKVCVEAAALAISKELNPSSPRKQYLHALVPEVKDLARVVSRAIGSKLMEGLNDAGWEGSPSVFPNAVNIYRLTSPKEQGE